VWTNLLPYIQIRCCEDTTAAGWGAAARNRTEPGLEKFLGFYFKGTFEIFSYPVGKAEEVLEEGVYGGL